MQKSVGLSAAVCLVLGTPAWSADAALTFASETAVVFDDEGTPLVRAQRAYLLDWAGNPDGALFAIDRERQRVRVTPDGAPALWLRCADLAGSPCDPQVDAADVDGGKTAPVKAAAARPAKAAATRPARSAAARSAPGEEADEGSSSHRLPICPGDPRCPR